LRVGKNVGVEISVIYSRWAKVPGRKVRWSVVVSYCRRRGGCKTVSKRGQRYVKREYVRIEVQRGQMGLPNRN